MRAAAYKRLEAVVEELMDGDLFVGYAISPDGERRDAPINSFSGGVDDYEYRKASAQQVADQAITLATGHEQCSCPAWH